MKRIVGTLLLCSILAAAADFKTAKVIEVRDASELGANVDTDVKGDGKTTTISPGIAYRCEVTVALEGVKYTAIYASSKHLNPSELVAGESILARVEGNKLVLQVPDGKQAKAKIVSRIAVK
jgi:hypothetical protein